MDNRFEFRDRVIYSEQDNKEKVERILKGLDRVCNSSSLQKFLSKEDFQDLEAGMENLRQRASDKLTIVVAGSFKRGKSSLINSLIGQDVVPTSVSPETMTINKIMYGETNGAEMVLKNGMRLKLYDDEITRQKLEKIMVDLPAPIDYLEIYCNSPLLENLTFIDTPGLGESETDYRQKIASIMTGADIIIYVISALSPVSADEQEFLNAVVMPQNFSKMFVVINMADAMDSSNDIERVEKEVVRRVMAFNNNASVFSLSALDEICRKKGAARPNAELAEYLEQNYQTFEDALSNDIIMQRELIKSQRTNSLGYSLVQMLKNRLNSIKAMMDMDAEKLQETERHLLEQKINTDNLMTGIKGVIQDFVDQKKKEARVWMADFLERVKKELEQARDGRQDGKELQKHIYFYLSDKLKEAFVVCLNTHAEELEEMLQREIDDIDKLAFGGEDAYSGVNIRLRDISWTNVDSAVYVGGFALSLLGIGVSSLLLDALFGFVREQRVSKSQKNIVEPLLKQFPQICNQIYEQLEKAYDDYSATASSKVEEFFRKSIDDAIRVVDNAKKVKEEFEGQTAQSRQEIDRILLELDELLA